MADIAKLFSQPRPRRPAPVSTRPARRTGGVEGLFGGGADTPTTTTTAPAPRPPSGGGGVAGLFGGRQPTPAPAPQPSPVDVEEGGRLLGVAFEQGAFPSYEAAPQQVEQMSAFISRLYEYGMQSGDQEALDSAIAARSMASDIIPPEVVEKYGLDRIEIREGGGGVLGSIADFGSKIPGMTWLGEEVALPAIRFADSASQGTLAAVGSVREGRYWEGAQAFSQGVTYGAVGNLMDRLGIVDDQDGGRQVLEQAVSRFDQDGDGVLNWREAQGLDSEGGGRLAGFFDTVLVGIFDPFTWVGVSPAARARAGLTAVAATQGDDVARAVARQGLDILDDRAQREVQGYLTTSIEQAQAARRSGFWSRIGLRDESITGQVDNVLEGLQGGVGTVRVGSANVRIPMFDAAVYRVRPGYGSGVTRRTPTAVRLWDEGEEGTEAALDQLFRTKGLSSVDTFQSRTIDDIVGEAADPTDEFAALRGTLADPDAPAQFPADATREIRVDGTVYAPDGSDAGTWTRRLYDNGEAYFQRLEINPDYRGKGIGSDFLQRQVDELSDAGFHTIRLTAGLEDGPMVWGRRGFVIDTTRQAEVVDWLDDLAYRLDNMIDELPADELSLRGQGGAVLNRDVLENIRDRALRARENPTAANIAELGDPSGDVWRALNDALPDGIAGRSGGIPMVRGLDAQDTLRTIDGGQRLGQRLAGTRVGQAFGEAFRPRSQLQSKLGDYAEEVYDTLRVRRGSSVFQEMEDLFTRLGPAADRAAREVGSMEEADRLLREALENRSSAAVLGRIERLIREGMPDTAEYLRTASRIRREIDQAGGLDPDQLRRGYFPRVFTKEGREAVMEEDDLLRLMGLDAAKLRSREARFHHPRTFMPESSIEDVNRKLSEILDLPEGTKLFEESVVGAFAQRGEAAYRAAADLDMLKGLEREFVGEGADRSSMVIRVAPGEKAPAGYRQLNDIAQEWYARREVANEIERMHGFLTNDARLAQLSEFFDNWSKTWGAYATAPLIDGLGFHSRNAASNVILNATAGVINPAHYARAIDVQSRMARVFNHMRRTGKPFDDAMQAVGVSDTDQALFRALRDNGIIDRGWFADIAPTQKTPRPRGQGVLTQYDGSWDFLQNNVAVSSGRALGQAVEQNARIAHFVAKLQAGNSIEEAARSVRKFLFDYGDLTGVERALRNASRFYTFMRKNAGVQLWALTRNPGRINTIQRATGGGLAGALGLSPGIPGQPDYSRERGDTTPLGDILGGDAGNIIGSIDTPFQAFAENFIRPAFQVSALIEGEGTAQELVGSLVNLTSGGQRSFTDAVYTTLTNYNPAFQRELTDRERGAEAVAMRWLDATLGPAWSQLDRAVGRVTEGEGVGFLGNEVSAATEEYGHELAILSNILGLNAAAVDDETEQQRDVLFMLYGELSNQLDDLREQGETVPTIDQLRQAGIIPELPESVRRARSVVIEEDIRELEEAGLPTSALESELAEVLQSEREQGYQIEPETGAFTTRSARATALAEQNGLYQRDDAGEIKRDEDGKPIPVTSSSTVVRVLWNRENPDDPYVKDDGTPYTYADISPRWPTAMDSEVREWMIERGASRDGVPVTERTSVNQAMRDAYNREHPDRPALTSEQRLEAGIRPTYGVYEVVRDGQVRAVIWPEGMSEDNWWLTDPVTGERLGPESASSSSPTSGLGALFD